MKIAVPVWVLALLGLIIIALVVIVWSVKRRRRPHLGLEPTSLEDLFPSIAGATQTTITEGNQVEIVQNGELWEWVFRDLEQAKETINYETFLAKEGELTRRMVEMFCKKAGQGVQVRMMLDGSGGKNFGKEGLAQMRDAGCKVNMYHPMKLRNLGTLNNRDHRKIFIIDGRIGYVGGHCLVDSWLGDAEDKQHFRDISVRVRGPAVAQLQSTFTENWIEETGEVIGGTSFFPWLDPVGDMKAHAVWLSPAGSPSTLKLLHYIAIREATKSLTIQNPYFLPDPDARDALLAAVRRGVHVRIMLPAAHATDSPIVQHASHHHFGTLLKGGVRIFEYHHTLLHQKVFTVDSCWVSVGSTNFDDRAFEINDEVSLVVYDEGIARELEETFEADLEHATEVAFDEWKKRPALHKAQDFSAFLLNEQL